MSGFGSRPLTGLKVVELAHIMAGPVCGMMLADFGADVIKVEKSPDGDDTRRMAPPDMQGESAAYVMLNRNKRGTVINLKHEDGKRALRRLLKTADVVIENYRPGTMERLGLGYDSLVLENPGLIYCQITGFGNTGPYAGRAGFDLIAQGMSGLMSITGEGPGHPPIKVGAPVGDITAGIIGAMGILAAYIHRLKTGRGQHIDTSLFEASMIHTYWQSAIFFSTAVIPGPMGTAHPLSAPYQAFQTSDSWINVGAANQANWLRLLEVLGAQELARDPRFINNVERLHNLAPLVDRLAPLFRQRTTADWMTRLEAAGVPAGPVLNLGEALSNPQTLAREMVVEINHPKLGKQKVLGIPVKFSATPGAITRPAPCLGEHTSEVLTEIGYSPKEIELLADAGAVILGGGSHG
jgi:crotonobetainyl-CoA:carnitine CoA-transferase CaiB-like acyl-CoA transferase